MTLNHVINVGDLDPLKSVTVNLRVKGLRWWHFKVRCGMLLCRLGVWLAGANYEEDKA